jgi:ribonucleoside-diphosphate reductase alpha chain
MAQATSLSVGRFFTKANKRAYDQLVWEPRESRIDNPGTGKVVFEQKNLEFSEGWSQNAINIVTQKYFAGTPGTPEREGSLKQLVDRVADTITRHGVQEGYFENEAEAENFREELKYICATQRAAFNSPVWFNIGWFDRSQQASACFILGVEDTMESILNWYTEEGMIFKGGSGAGTNLSKLRSSSETLGSSGGKSSGPVSFMRGADSVAGTIKSGGKTRRAAKMVILNVDHPDIEEFIWCKAIEERKSRVLQAAGFDMSLDGKDGFSVQYQNANNSVRVTDEFMHAVLDDTEYDLMLRDGRPAKTVKAREIFRQISEAAWECADPGMQFDTTINKWHTTPNAGRINASNPCSEYMHLDNSACNLASINLLKYLNNDNTFDVEAFKHTVEVIFTAQEILVGYSSNPTESITKNAKAFRELGLGYANLGALLMAQGLPYDSEEGRAQAAAITALMTGYAYATSAKLARRVGPFAGFHKDRDAMLNVLKMHRSEVSKIDAALVSENLLSAAMSAWDEAVELGEIHGVRNSQASVLAPTGTIGLMMDCDTTGVEPDFALTKYKSLVGGGGMVIVNQTVPRALKTMGYTKEQSDEIVSFIAEKNTIDGAPHLKTEHQNVFACAVGFNSIHYLGHVKMMSAVQPFISGAISKTVNMPEESTVEDIEQLHIDAWRMGIKAVAIYRDGSKVAQPLSDKKKSDDETEMSAAKETTVEASEGFIVKGAVKRELPRRRNSHTYEFKIADLKGFFTVGEYDDGTPGELFVTVSKQGSTLSGLMDSFARSVSHGLKYGVPLKSYVKTLMSTSFAPAGMTDDAEIKTASSITDYIFRRLALDYLSFDDRLELGLASFEDMPDTQASLAVDEVAISTSEEPAALEEEVIFTEAKASKKPGSKDNTAPLCYNCGNQTQRAGSCYVCSSCGSTTGCS